MLSNASYGKSRIRLVRVARRGDRHDVRDLTVAIRFDGEYGTSYTEGNNRDVLPTDTMKNTVYALAAGGVGEPESFGLKLARHFLERNPRLRHVSVDLTEHQWRPIAIGEREHGQAFMRRGPDTRSAIVSSSRDHLVIDAGIADLVILKTAGSAFTGFLRDEYTTLPETSDRLFATSLTASWRYAVPDVEFGPAWRVVRGILLETFALHVSESVQHTLYAMGEAVLANVDHVASITLTMPNRHHLPVDLTPFGLENRNEVFVATEEPHGLIEATLTR
jgi:urate oxidase